MRIISPRSYVSATTTSPFELFVDKLFFPTNANITVALELSTNEAFTNGVTSVTPAKIIIVGSSPEVVITNGTVPPAHAGKKIKIQHTHATSEKKYVRIKVTQNSKNYVSNALLLSTQAGSGTIMSKVVQKGYRPEYISFHDIYDVTGDSSALTIRVEVCNNALDQSPTWENATTAYLNHEPYKFTNNNKTASNYGVRVKITVTKAKPTGSFNLYKMQFIVT